MDSCESYDVNQDKWMIMASCKQKRFAACSISVKEQKKIYLFGGRKDDNNTLASEIEEYDLPKNQWNLIYLEHPQIY